MRLLIRHGNDGKMYFYGASDGSFFVRERQVRAWRPQSSALQLRSVGIRFSSLQPFQKLIRKSGIRRASMMRFRGKS